VLGRGDHHQRFPGCHAGDQEFPDRIGQDPVILVELDDVAGGISLDQTEVDGARKIRGARVRLHLGHSLSGRRGERSGGPGDSKDGRAKWT